MTARRKAPLAKTNSPRASRIPEAASSSTDTVDSDADQGGPDSRRQHRYGAGGAARQRNDQLEQIRFGAEDFGGQWDVAMDEADNGRYRKIQAMPPARESSAVRSRGWSLLLRLMATPAIGFSSIATTMDPITTAGLLVNRP